jgi:hypothetical protein
MIFLFKEISTCLVANDQIFGVCKALPLTLRIMRHKPQIFGHGNIWWNFNKISPGKEISYLL